MHVILLSVRLGMSVLYPIGKRYIRVRGNKLRFSNDAGGKKRLSIIN